MISKEEAYLTIKNYSDVPITYMLETADGFYTTTEEMLSLSKLLPPLHLFVCLPHFDNVSSLHTMSQSQLCGTFAIHQQEPAGSLHLSELHKHASR